MNTTQSPETETLGSHSSQPSCSAKCDCVNWCDANSQHRLLTGHHENCPRSPRSIEKALDLIMLLADGMERWASDEDGIHPDAWEAYRRAKGLEGVIFPNDQRGSVLTCVYCGQEYPQDTPSWGNQVLTDHIKACEKHPMRKLEADNAKLRKALVGLVGADTKEELEGMDAAIRVMPMPDEDRMNTINAIHALRDTAP